MKFKDIKEIDVFGPRIELRLHNKKSHKTFCGATMTIFVFLCCVTAVIIIGKGLIQKNNPNVTFRSILADETNNNILSDTNKYGSFKDISLGDIQLAVSIKDLNGEDIPSNFRNMVQVTINYVEKTGETYQRTKISLEECTQKSISYYELGSVDSSAYICLSKSELYTLWGYQSDYSAHYFEMNISCISSDCNVLYQHYPNLKLQMLYKDQYFTPDYYDESFTPLYTNRFIEFQVLNNGIDGSQDYDFILQKATVVTDEGWIQAMYANTNYLVQQEFGRSYQSLNSSVLTVNISIYTLRTVYEVIIERLNQRSKEIYLLLFFFRREEQVQITYLLLSSYCDFEKSVSYFILPRLKSTNQSKPSKFSNQ